MELMVALKSLWHLVSLHHQVLCGKATSLINSPSFLLKSHSFISLLICLCVHAHGEERGQRAGAGP